MRMAATLALSKLGMTIHGNGDHPIDLLLILAEIPSFIANDQGHLLSRTPLVRWRAVHVGPSDPEALPFSMPRV